MDVIIDTSLIHQPMDITALGKTSVTAAMNQSSHYASNINFPAATLLC
jgi:hypothetical protein